MNVTVPVPGGVTSGEGLTDFLRCLLGARHVGQYGVPQLLDILRYMLRCLLGARHVGQYASRAQLLDILRCLGRHSQGTVMIDVLQR